MLGTVCYVLYHWILGRDHGLGDSVSSNNIFSLLLAETISEHFAHCCHFNLVTDLVHSVSLPQRLSLIHVHVVDHQRHQQIHDNDTCIDCEQDKEKLKGNYVQVTRTF